MVQWYQLIISNFIRIHFNSVYLGYFCIININLEIPQTKMEEKEVKRRSKRDKVAGSKFTRKRV